MKIYRKPTFIALCSNSRGCMQIPRISCLLNPMAHKVLENNRTMCNFCHVFPHSPSITFLNLTVSRSRSISPFLSVFYWANFQLSLHGDIHRFYFNMYINRERKMDRKLNIACHSNQFVHKSNAMVRQNSSLRYFLLHFIRMLVSHSHLHFILCFQCKTFIFFTLPNTVDSIHTNPFTWHKNTEHLFAHIKPPIGVKEKYIENHEKLSLSTFDVSECMCSATKSEWTNSN